MVNEVDDAVPDVFQYVSDHVPSSEVKLPDSPLHSCLSNCICARPLESQAAKENSCPCLVGHTPFQYNRTRDLKSEVVDAEEPICNEECRFVETGGCPQKVATAKSPSFKFEVFRKSSGKWGVRTKFQLTGS